MARLELAFEGRVCTYGSGYLFFYIIQGQESTAVIILTLGARKGKQSLAFITKPVQCKRWGVSAKSVSICTSEKKIRVSGSETRVRWAICGFFSSVEEGFR